MKKFICIISSFFGVYVIAVFGFVAIRIYIAQDADRAATTLQPGQDILFVGDSHTGCVIAERRKFHNKVIWCESLPPQFTLMRLRDLEASGQLKQVKVFALECWVQNLGYQTKDQMKLFWFRSLPFSWRHFDAIPLSWWDALTYLSVHFGDEMRGTAPFRTENTSILDRTAEERESDLAETMKSHFAGFETPSRFCDSYESSVQNAIVEMKDICDRNGVRIVAYTAPCTSFYRSKVPAVAKMAYQDILMSKVKDFGIPFCNAIDWMPDRAFRDCFHLTANETENFTEKFYHDFLRSCL